MPTRILAQKLLLPERRLQFVKWKRHRGDLNLFVEKHSDVEVCPKCATPSRSIYDHRRICPERENVRYVICDLADPFKNFARSFFPNAAVIADKFHVLRLLTPAPNRRRKAITGDRRTLPVRKMLLRSGAKLRYIERTLLAQWLEKHPELAEVYRTKEALHAFYRMRGTERAARALTRLTDAMASSLLPEMATLRRTLIKWRAEIRAYFGTGLTNGRTEGFNTKAKLVKRRAYG